MNIIAEEIINDDSFVYVPYYKFPSILLNVYHANINLLTN